MNFQSRRFPVVQALIAAAFAVELFAAVGIHELDLQVKALVYDPVSEKIYATGANGLLQLDPLSGQVLRTFAIGTNLSRLDLGANRGLWIGYDNEGAVRRFNLETLTPEEKIVVQANTNILDISASDLDPYTLAVSVGTNVSPTPFKGSADARAFIIRNGTVLPHTQEFQYLALQGDVLFASTVGAVAEVPVTPNGLSIVSPKEVRQPWYGDIQYHDGLLFHAEGFALRNFQRAASYDFVHAWASTTFGLNREAGEILFVSAKNAGAVLNWFSTAGEHRGEYIFPTLDNTLLRDKSVVFWRSDRAAFHTSSKVYLLEMEKLFPAVDLEVAAIGVKPAAPAFGEPISVSVTVTNRGPGSSLGSVVTFSYPADAVLLAGNPSTTVDIPAGSAVDLALTLVPSKPGPFSIAARVDSGADVNPTNDTRDILVTIGRDRSLTRLPIQALDLAYDSVSDSLFYMDGTTLWTLRLTPFTLSALFNINPAPHAAMDAGGGALFLTSGYFNHFDSRTLNGSVWRPFRTAQYPNVVSISPANAQLVALGDTTATFLVHNGEVLAERGSRSLSVDFTDDGSRLYLVNAQNCALELYAVTDAGLVLEQVHSNAPCTEFVATGGLVFFATGEIYDPATRQARPESLVLAAPSHVAEDGRGNVQWLARTNAIWTLRQMQVPALRELSSVTLPNLPGSVVDFVSAGENRIAVRTTSEIIVQELGAPQQNFRIAQWSETEIVLAFPTEIGKRYQVERSVNLLSGSWGPVGNEIAGTGNEAEQVLTIEDFVASFYRLVTF